MEFSATQAKILEQINSRQKDLNDLAIKFAEAEYQLMLLFQIFPDLVIVADTDGKIVRTSNSSKHILHYEPEEIMGKFIWDFIVKEDQAKTIEFFNEMVAQGSYSSTGVENSFVNRWTTKDGYQRKLLWRVHAFNEEHQQLIGIATNITTLEFTDFKNANLLYSAVEHLANGVVITDNLQEDNPIVYANHMFLNICGYTMEELLGRNCRFLQDPQCHGTEVKLKLKEALASGVQHQCIFKNRTKAGKVFFNFLTVIPIIKDTIITNYIGITKDATQDVLDGKYKWDPSYPVGYLTQD